MKYIESHSAEVAAAKSGFSDATGYRINRDPTFPSQKKTPRGRRRPDALAVLVPGKREISAKQDRWKKHLLSAKPVKYPPRRDVKPSS